MKLKLENVYKYYDKNLILNDISIECDNHKVIAIIGPSGSGKSTLLRQLSMIEKPNSGKIEINNVVLDESNIRNYQKTIGFVFQHHNLFPHLSVERNITLILEKSFKYSKEEAIEKSNELLSQFGILDLKDKLPKNISGGQAQRASIARALSTNSEILFLDEPTASLDPILTREVLGAIIALKNMDKDFVIVTHEINFVKEVADYYIFMSDGKIVNHGEISELNNSSSDELNNFLSMVL